MEDSNVEEEAVGTLSEYMDGLEAQELVKPLSLCLFVSLSLASHELSTYAKKSKWWGGDLGRLFHVMDTEKLGSDWEGRKEGRKGVLH
jgi:hypothetical protein